MLQLGHRRARMAQPARRMRPTSAIGIMVGHGPAAQWCMVVLAVWLFGLPELIALNGL